MLTSYDLCRGFLIDNVEIVFTDLAVNPLGESIWTAAWNNTAQTSQYVRQKEKRWLGDGFFCNHGKKRKPVSSSVEVTPFSNRLAATLQ